MAQKLPKNKAGRERRASPRTDTQIWATERTEDNTSFHLVSNLSLSGLHIAKKLPLSNDSIINLELELSGPGERVKVKGVVKSTYKDSDSNITGTGVAFVEMNSETRNKIEKYLRACAESR